MGLLQFTCINSMKANNYQHLFFDLDRTLWDFDANNKQTFNELYEKFDLFNRGIKEPDILYAHYQKINLSLWEEYKHQLISKETLNFRRFSDTLMLYGIDDHALALEMGAYYIRISPMKTLLYPGTLEILERLEKQYQLHIITNGFEEVQYIKLEKSGLERFFRKIITSERAGYKKPDRRIFEFAMEEAGANPENSIIIGDDPEADIWGAKQFGMDQIWVKHPPVKPAIDSATFEVDSLLEINKIL